jgi:hypothetical protein
MLYDIPRLYISELALLYAVQPVRIYPIFLMSFLLYYCYERMRERISQVEQMMVKVVEEDEPSQTKLSDL